MSVASESPSLIPLRWPAEWRDPAVLDTIRATPINALFTDAGPLPGPVAERAQTLGLALLDQNHPPGGVKIVDGEWPGVRLSRASRNAVDAGPTGVPWIDSNTWRVQLQRTLAPGQAVWIRSRIPKRVILPEEIPIALADSAVAGGRWILTPPPEFQAWTRLSETLRFFAAHPEWPAMNTKAVLGVFSSFTGPYEAMASEVLNLTARMHQPYRILLPGPLLPDLRAIVFADVAPSSVVRTQLLDYVRKGGLLVLNETWHWEELADAAASRPETPGGSAQAPLARPTPVHPRFTMHAFGLGRVAIPKETVQDPFEFAADAQLLMSHRWDPVTFWNAAAYGSHLTAGPHGETLLHLVNYTGSEKGNPVTARVRGEYTTASFLVPGRPPRTLPVKNVDGAAELHLPGFPFCAALELTSLR